MSQLVAGKLCLSLCFIFYKRANMANQQSAKNGYKCVKAENQYATVFLFTNPLSPLLSRWLVKRTGKKKEKKKSASQ